METPCFHIHTQLRNLNTLLDFVKSNRHNYVQPGWCNYTSFITHVILSLVHLTTDSTSIIHSMMPCPPCAPSPHHPGRLTDAERDQIEQEVALSVRTCSANIERLERNVQLSQNIQPPNGPNQSTIAFRLGVVRVGACECIWCTLARNPQYTLYYTSKHRAFPSPTHQHRTLPPLWPGTPFSSPRHCP